MNRPARALTLALLLAACGVATAFTLRFVQGVERERQRELFQLKAAQVGHLLQYQFDEHGRFLFAVGKVFDETNINSSAQFSRLARGYLEHRPELRLISLAHRVSLAQRSSFEQWGRSLIPDFRVRELSGAPRSAAAEGDAFVVTYIEPKAGNERVLGVDLKSEPVRAHMIDRAVERHLAAASAPLTLLQGSAPQQAILLAQEIMSSTAAGEGGTFGVLVAAIEIKPYLKRTLERTDFGAHPIRFEDITEAKPRLMHDDMPGRTGADEYQRPLALGGRNYLLTIGELPLATAPPGPLLLGAMAACLLVSVLLAAVVLLASGRRHN